VTVYDSIHGWSRRVSRASAGAAIRRYRNSLEWSLADLSAESSISIPGLSLMERGERKPRKSTVRKLENALGLPSGTYSRLLTAEDPDAELASVLATTGAARRPERPGPGVVVARHNDADVLQGYAEAQIETIKALASRLPPSTSDDYESYILSVIEQCVKAEMLTADSWRVTVNAGADLAGQLMKHLHTLEDIRAGLLKRLPDSLAAQFDAACARSGLPDAILAQLLGITAEEIWATRNQGAIPPGAVPRVRAFVAAAKQAADNPP
jgi:transcriptional regulator with XRE-family HTH domain/lambda repressor-like predicted transcriptional regulator